MIQKHFNAISSGATGMFGKQVVRYFRHGREIIAKAPCKRPGRGTPGQERTRANFQQATDWSKKVRSARGLTTIYEAFVGGGKNIHNLAIADYLMAPEVHDLFVKDGIIRVKATDNLQVASVCVCVYDANGYLLEEGMAVNEGGDEWVYKPVLALQPGCDIVVIARDLPGNECRYEIALPARGEQPVFVKVTVSLLSSACGIPLASSLFPPGRPGRN
ncbi:hypothetical protein MKQ68_11780 [Chitinophaga horti]|uniref:Uncharacterized protein n=1 Tax=Chitinophaga horti TaxID=2920382 RepID=A0ABY6JB35_9BACT|nr:hypothetical protein [Chitinophaga horti]UYQ95782.1 hypothetical protein MKQ68_11780 [Chitinophaga horti]